VPFWVYELIRSQRLFEEGKLELSDIDLETLGWFEMVAAERGRLQHEQRKAARKR